MESTLFIPTIDRMKISHDATMVHLILQEACFGYFVRFASLTNIKNICCMRNETKPSLGLSCLSFCCVYGVLVKTIFYFQRKYKVTPIQQICWIGSEASLQQQIYFNGNIFGNKMLSITKACIFQIYRKFHLQNLKIFRKKKTIFFMFLLKT